MTTSPTPSPVRAGWKFLLRHPAHMLSFGFGAGLSPVAPGTVGTLVAFPLFPLFFWVPSIQLALLVIVVLFAIGAWAAQISSRALGVADHGGIVWDEIVAYLLVLLFVPPSLAWFAASFAAFRFFDIVKPFPIGLVDRTIKNGVGVMLDDILAALYSLLVLKLAERFIHGVG